MTKSLSFNSFEKRFLIDVKDLLCTLKGFELDWKQQNAILEQLERLIDSSISELPDHFSELNFHLSLLFDLNQDSYDYIEILETCYSLCCLMQEEPSVDLFKKVISDGYCFLFDHRDFPEQVLFDVINMLKSLSIDSNISSIERQNISSEDETALWLGLARMFTTEQILLEVIKSARVPKKEYDFYQYIAISANGNENVLLELINRIENSKYPDSKFYRELKGSIYAFILAFATPTESVIIKIIEIINFDVYEEYSYYNFFYEIIQNFAKDNAPDLKRKILGAIIERINHDEPKANEERKVFINRLRLLAYNL